MKALYITPKTKVADLLDYYPQLEDKLIEMTPVFKKLKNPVLRKTIAKVTTLEQAAAVGSLKVDQVVNTLRKEVGQDDIDEKIQQREYIIGAPHWFNSDKIVKTFDAVEMIRNGGHPLGDVMRDVNNMKDDEIYELITPFLPAPLIDKVKEQGCHTWIKKEQEDLYRNYFYKKS